MPSVSVGQSNNDSLASLLRECACIVERNESSALLFRAVEALNNYAEYADDRIRKSNSHDRLKNNSTSCVSSNIKKRPAFQRPTNKNSTLIANGWIEQQRKSKLRRVVWKEVLVSLVEARKPCEETTLWIQREIVVNGESQLDALHQIPMKWLLDVQYLDYYGDFRMSLLVYGVNEPFIFRTSDEDACREWVATLNSAREASDAKSNMNTAAFPDLLNGDGMTNGSDESAKSRSHQSRNDSDSFPHLNDIKSSIPHHPTESRAQNGATISNERMSITELRAIAHGAGYDTRGMERADLEKIAAYCAPASAKGQNPKPQNIFTANHHSKTVSTDSSSKYNSKSSDEEHMKKSSSESGYRKGEHDVEINTEKQQEYKDQIYHDDHARAVETQRLKEQQEALRAAEAQRLKEEDEEAQRLRVQQEALKAAEAQRIKEQENEKKAAEAHRMKQEQDSRSKSQQHDAWDQHWHESTSAQGRTNNLDSKDRRSQVQTEEPANIFESARFGGIPQTSAHIPMPPQQKHFNHHQPIPPHTSPPPPPFNPRASDPTSPMNQKYAKQMTGPIDDQVIIKRNILVHWALVPPRYNMLRPIDQLLVDIQTVFPPFGNVAPHDYFSKWTPIVREDLILSSAMGNSVDDAKIKKAVRKLRVFLHPDRLPKDFDSIQCFVCKMLWDVTNDAEEEFLKQKSDLDWIHK